MLKPPKEFEVESGGENFLKWKQRFELYMRASGGENKEEETKIAILLHCMGEKTLDIYNTLELNEEEKKDYIVVLKKLEEYFVPQRNETIKRHIFFTRGQLEGENFDNFFTELKKLSMDCEFGQLRDSLIRDRIICGLYDNKLKDRLLREPNLTLVQCVNMCRAAELAGEQRKVLEPESGLVGAIGDMKGRDKVRVSYGSDNGRNCWRCEGSHPKWNCPAYHKVCGKCHKKGHYTKVCRFKKVNVVDEELMVGSVECKDWFENIQVKLPGKKSVDLKIKLDTGAQVNVLPIQNLKSWGVKISRSKIKLQNYKKALQKNSL